MDDDEVASELNDLEGGHWSIGDDASALWIRIQSHQISGREVLPR